MRHFIDTGILLGKVLEDDDFRDVSEEFFTGFHYGELEIVHQVMFDLESMVQEEANIILLDFLRFCPVMKLKNLNKDEAKANIRTAFGKIKRAERMKHSGIKDEVKEMLYRAVDEGTLIETVKGLHIGLPRRIRDKVSGCLGVDVILLMSGVANGEAEEETKAHIVQELAAFKGTFGEHDDHDRRILSGLALECWKGSDIEFFTYDKPFFEGYKKMWSAYTGQILEPCRRLTFMYINPHNLSAGRTAFTPPKSQ